MAHVRYIRGEKDSTHKYSFKKIKLRNPKSLQVSSKSILLEIF